MLECDVQTPAGGRVVGEERDEVTQWIEESMIYVKKREEFEQNNPLLLTLFRYLGMLYRINNPMAADGMPVQEGLLKQMYAAIAGKGVEYMELEK